MKRRKLAVASVPAMVPCPTCAMPVQSGRGPHKLAWHDCEFVLARTRGPITVEDVQQLLLRRMAECAADAKPSELASIGKALGAIGGGGARGANDDSDVLDEWLRDTA